MSLRSRTAVVVLIACATGCTELWGSDPAQGACEPVGPDPDRGELPALEEGDAGRIEVSTTDNPGDVPGLTTLQGRGTDRVGAISIVDGVGSMEFGCTRFDAAIFTYGYRDRLTHYFAVASTGDRLYFVDFECRTDGTLYGVTFVGTDGTQLSTEYADGRCGPLHADADPRVRLPALDFPVPAPVPGTSLSGPELDLPEGEIGTVTLDGVTRRLAVFADYRCSEEGCDPPGWRRLDALAFGPASGEVVYLRLFVEPPYETAEIYTELTLPGAFGTVEQTEIPLFQ